MWWFSLVFSHVEISKVEVKEEDSMLWMYTWEAMKVL